jgi:hypothetical protein
VEAVEVLEDVVDTTMDRTGIIIMFLIGIIAVDLIGIVMLLLQFGKIKV